MAETIFSYCSSTCFYSICRFLGLMAETPLPIKVGLVNQCVLALAKVGSGYDDCLWHQSLFHWHISAQDFQSPFMTSWFSSSPVLVSWKAGTQFVTSGWFPHNRFLSFPICSKAESASSASFGWVYGRFWQKKALSFLPFTGNHSCFFQPFAHHCFQSSSNLLFISFHFEGCQNNHVRYSD